MEESNHYYPFGGLFGESCLNTDPYKYNGKELDRMHGLNWYDYSARLYDPMGGGGFPTMDPLCEKYYSISPYAYCMNNPVRYIDLDGTSTHTDSLGNVVAVYNNGDMGVYKHGISSETYDGSELTVDGGAKMGETEYWDEFINPESGNVMIETTITFGDSFDPIIDLMNRFSSGMNMIEIAANSGGGGLFDIKNRHKNKGALLNGKYVTARSAGNYLAGYNAAKGKLFGLGIGFDTFQKLAGALHIKEASKQTLSRSDKVRIVLLNKIYGNYPTYGEEYYQYRMSRMGWNNAKK